MKLDVYYSDKYNFNKPWHVIKVDDESITDVQEAFKAVDKLLAESNEEYIKPMFGFIRGGKYGQRS